MWLSAVDCIAACVLSLSPAPFLFYLDHKLRDTSAIKQNIGKNKNMEVLIQSLHSISVDQPFNGIRVPIRLQLQRN